MEPSVVPEAVRRATMAGLMVVHLQFAAFLIGIFVLGVVMELFGFLSPGHPYLDRFARSLGRTAVILYSTGAVLAIAFILVISIFWPTFWYLLVRVTFWPFVLEGITFVLTVLYLFPWYFTWDSLARFKPVHLAMGSALAMVAQFQQSMIDVVAGYMLTPTPHQSFLRVFFNPTAIPLDVHRTVGDISFAGFVVAGFAAFRMLRARDPNQRRFYDWAGSMALLAGLAFLFLQPAIGIAYLEETRANSPGAFTTMMRGRLSWLFLLQVVFLSALFLLSMLYMWFQLRKSGRHSRLLTILLVISVLSALLLVQPYVLGPSQTNAWVNWVNPLGSMQPWKYIAFAGLTLSTVGALLAYLGSQRRGLSWGQMGPGARGAQYSLLALAILGSFMMALMGYIRENSRIPFLIYPEMRLDSPQLFPTPQPPPTPGPSSQLAPGSPSFTVGPEGEVSP